MAMLFNFTLTAGLLHRAIVPPSLPISANLRDSSTARYSGRIALEHPICARANDVHTSDNRRATVRLGKLLAYLITCSRSAFTAVLHVRSYGNIQRCSTFPADSVPPLRSRRHPVAPVKFSIYAFFERAGFIGT